MRRVLIDPRRNTLHDVVAPGSEFRVAAPLKWVDAPDNIDPRTWVLADEVPQPPPVPVEAPAIDALEAAAFRELINHLMTTNAANLPAVRAYLNAQRP